MSYSPKPLMITFLALLLILTGCKKNTKNSETLTLSPANNPTEIHLFGSGTINQSDNTAPEIGAASWTYESNPIAIRAVFKFDFSQLPLNAEILTSKLSLYSNPNNLNGHSSGPNFGTNNAMSIQRITDNWDTQATWNTQPGSTSQNQVVIPHTDQSSLDLIDIDVTNLVRDMLETSNYGFKIQLVNETPYNARIFCSSKYPDTKKHPRLVITYKKK